jgi:FkbM family methyltransferase
MLSFTYLQLNIFSRYIKAMSYTIFHGEDLDGISSDEIISSYFDPSFVGTMLDVGASHPIENSCSYYFERNGWEVIMVEANPFWIPLLKTERRGKVLNYAATEKDMDDADFFVAHFYHEVSGAISSLQPDDRLVRMYAHMVTGSETVKVTARRLDWILMHHAADCKKIDVVSIDVEGGELAALRGFDIQRWQPALFVIENNFEDHDIRDYLGGYGYRLDRRESVNEYFLKK